MRKCWTKFASKPPRANFANNLHFSQSTTCQRALAVGTRGPPADGLLSARPVDADKLGRNRTSKPPNSKPSKNARPC